MHLCVCVRVCVRTTLKWLLHIRTTMITQMCGNMFLCACLHVHRGRWGSTQPFVCVLVLATGGVSGAGGRWAVGLNRDWAGAERWQLREGGGVRGRRGQERVLGVSGDGGRRIKRKWIICGGQEKCGSAVWRNASPEGKKCLKIDR